MRQMLRRNGSNGGFGGGGGGSVTADGSDYPIGGTGGFGGGGGTSNTPSGPSSSQGSAALTTMAAMAARRGRGVQPGYYPSNGGFGGGGGSSNAGFVGGGGGGAAWGSRVCDGGAQVTSVMDTTQEGALGFSGNTVTGGAQAPPGALAPRPAERLGHRREYLLRQRCGPLISPRPRATFPSVISAARATLMTRMSRPCLRSQRPGRPDQDRRGHADADRDKQYLLRRHGGAAGNAAGGRGCAGLGGVTVTGVRSR